MPSVNLRQTQRNDAVTTSLTQDQIDQFVAACHGNFAGVREQLAGHPELLNSRSSLDESPLGAAAHVGNREIAEYLVAQGAVVDLPAAAMLGDLPAMQALLADAPEAAQGAGAHGIPVLFHAVAGGNLDAVELLLASGAERAHVTGPESGALNIAAARGHVAMARWLLDNGAPTDVTDFQDKTPLERAQEGGFTEIVELLQAAQR